MRQDRVCRAAEENRPTQSLQPLLVLMEVRPEVISTSAPASSASCSAASRPSIPAVSGTMPCINQETTKAINNSHGCLVDDEVVQSRLQAL